MEGLVELTLHLEVAPLGLLTILGQNSRNHKWVDVVIHKSVIQNVLAVVPETLFFDVDLRKGVAGKKKLTASQWATLPSHCNCDAPLNIVCYPNPTLH